MNLESIVLELALIIGGAALLGTLFLYIKQPIIIAYILLGVIIGPHALGLLPRTGHIEQISHIGVILLLFILGLNLQPLKLAKLFKKTALFTLGTSIVFAGVSFGFAMLLRFSFNTALIFAAAMMFSSTVIGLKLIPATTLHHRHIGEMMTSVLLIQDIMAIMVILFITGEKSGHVLATFGLLAGKFILLCLVAFAGVRIVIIPLLTKFDIIQEYTFVATLAWCLIWAEAAHSAGLSYEMGAFVAGLSIASCRIALVIAEHLKPLREFFLILFFFALGAKIDFRMPLWIILAAVLFGTVLVPLKASVFRLFLHRSRERKNIIRELPVRLAQSSEFSLLVAFSAVSAGLLPGRESMVIQIATITTFIISTYWVVWRYPTPISSGPASGDK